MVMLVTALLASQKNISNNEETNSSASYKGKYKLLRKFSLYKVICNISGTEIVYKDRSLEERISPRYRSRSLFGTASSSRETNRNLKSCLPLKSGRKV